MIYLTHSIFLPYSCEKMYKLVNDVNEYPKFFPGCIQTNILKSSEKNMVVSMQFFF